jgi:exodeoxyribonuclease VII large subunit
MNDKIYTISEITRLIKRDLEENPALNNIWLRGETTNITYHSSGHIYLTLKDENAVISAVLFRYANKNLSFKLEEGMSIFAFGSINVFEKRGNYQFIITQVKLEGIGELQKKIEELKKKLLAEGIFAPEHKKEIPSLPRRIGVVTSPTGAALRDIVKVALRRFPNIEILLAPATVQGDEAALSIVRGIEEMNNPEWKIDVIIAGRGGGSFEDLMPFNEEIVVRAFYNSRVPIISAVGHQIDHPLSDDAADLAAPTPSAAAEMAIPVKLDLQEYIDHLRARSYVALLAYIREMNTRIEGIMSRRIFINPFEIVYNQELVLNDIEIRIISFMKDSIAGKRNQFLMLPDLKRLMRALIKDMKHRYSIVLRNLESLSPLSVLQRGYSIARDDRGDLIRSIQDVNSGDSMDLLLYDGTLNCTINSKHSEVYLGKKEKE